MASYRTVFEIMQKGFAWDMPAMGISLIAVACFVYYRWKSRGELTRGKQVFTVIYLLLACLMTLILFVSIYRDFSEYRSAYARGDYSVVEGTVYDFRPEGWVRERESFSVNGITFVYSKGIVTPGFDGGAWFGGRLRDGLRIRVSHRDGIILKLEVQDHR